MPAIQRAYPRELNNVIIKATSEPFLNLPSGRGAMIADVTYRVGFQQSKMVITIDAERNGYLASAFRAIYHRHNQGTLIGRYYRVSGILTSYKPAGGSRRYRLDASSIVEFHSSNVPPNIYRGLGIVNFNSTRQMRRALRNPNLPRVQ